MARDMARAAGGRITLFHVIETVSGVTYDEFAPFYRELEGRASAHLIALASRFEGSGADVARTVVYGKPADEIVRFAVDNQSISSCWRHTRWICRALSGLGHTELQDWRSRALPRAAGQVSTRGSRASDGPATPAGLTAPQRRGTADQRRTRHSLIAWPTAAGIAARTKMTIHSIGPSRSTRSTLANGRA